MHLGAKLLQRNYIPDIHLNNLSYVPGVQVDFAFIYTYDILFLKISKMGVGDSVFTIIFIMMGVVAIIAGINFENKYREKFKGINKAEYIKLNKVALISMGGMILFGTFLAQGIPAFKDIITNITMVSLLVIWVIYSVISKKKFSNKNN